MEILKLCLVFSVIVIILSFKKPLNIAMIGGLISVIVIFQISIGDSAVVMMTSAVSKPTITILLGLYSVNVLQRMLEKKLRIKRAQEALYGIFNNRRINASLAPCIMGLLPSPGVLTIAGSIVKDSCEDYISAEDMTFISSFFRHIPESFLPTFPSIILMITLSGVSSGAFVLAMIPMVIVLFMLGTYGYLRKVPKETGTAPSVDKKREVLSLLTSIWSVIASIAIIMIFNLPVSITMLFIITLNFFVDSFTLKGLLSMLVSAFEWKVLWNILLIMLFKDMVIHSGVINLLPDFFSQFNMPLYLVFALIFFFGTIVSGSNAMIALCTPMAMSTVPEAGLPLVVLLMCCAYAAMQISPTHICLFIATSYFKTSLNSLIKRTLPIILPFCLIALMYYHVLRFMLF